MYLCTCCEGLLLQIVFEEPNVMYLVGISACTPFNVIICTYRRYAVSYRTRSYLSYFSTKGSNGTTSKFRFLRYVRVFDLKITIINIIVT